MWDSIWINANIATMAENNGCGIMENVAIAVENGKISWLGRQDDLSESPESLARSVTDIEGKWITPALIDCHTHLVYGGNRAKEFEMRQSGVSYEEIAKAGGGIISTVKATRAASEEELYESALPRLKALMSEGVRCVEIKSGYGLDIETEARMLSVATRLMEETNIKVKRTFLGAHAVPPEYAGKADDYIDHICDSMLPKLHEMGLIDAVDVFCEKIGFSTEQTRNIFEKASELGLPVKLHAEQLSNQGGAALASEYKAISVDHLEYLDEYGVKAIAESGTAAVLLPGAFYFLNESRKPPVDLLREYNVPIAIATDCNPGSSPVTSILLIMNMACTLFGLTPQEAIEAVTKNAAKALGIDDETGRIVEGRSADFVIWDVRDLAELSYNIGFNPCFAVVNEGVIS
jgi:imidazolonepropionase